MNRPVRKARTTRCKHLSVRYIARHSPPPLPPTPRRFPANTMFSLSVYLRRSGDVPLYFIGGLGQKTVWGETSIVRGIESYTRWKIVFPPTRLRERLRRIGRSAVGGPHCIYLFHVMTRCFLVLDDPVVRSRNKNYEMLKKIPAIGPLQICIDNILIKYSWAWKHYSRRIFLLLLLLFSLVLEHSK